MSMSVYMMITAYGNSKLKLRFDFSSFKYCPEREGFVFHHATEGSEYFSPERHTQTVNTSVGNVEFVSWQPDKFDSPDKLNELSQLLSTMADEGWEIANKEL